MGRHRVLCIRVIHEYHESGWKIPIFNFFFYGVEGCNFLLEYQSAMQENIHCCF